MPTATTDDIERVGQAICRERCAFYGEPPCFEIDGNWPPEACEPSCLSSAIAALVAMRFQPAEPTRNTDLWRTGGAMKEEER